MIPIVDYRPKPRIGNVRALLIDRRALRRQRVVIALWIAIGVVALVDAALFVGWRHAEAVRAQTYENSRMGFDSSSSGEEIR